MRGPQAWLEASKPRIRPWQTSTSAVRLLPNDVNYLSERSLIYFDLCLLELCSADCSKIIALDSKNAEAYLFWRGRCNLWLTDYDQARSDFLKAKTLAAAAARFDVDEVKARPH